VIAIGGKWNALPRVPKIVGAKQPVYVAAVRAFLESRGLRNPAVKIEQILRIDLDGDGEEEVLISATNYFRKDGSMPNASPAGSYSCVIERRVVKGEVRTRLIEGEFYPKAKTFNAPSQYWVAACSTGWRRREEVIVASNYYEGSATDDPPLGDRRVAQRRMRRVRHGSDQLPKSFRRDPTQRYFHPVPGVLNPSIWGRLLLLRHGQRGEVKVSTAPPRAKSPRRLEQPSTGPQDKTPARVGDRV
jgi:hypothetical protein